MECDLVGYHYLSLPIFKCVYLPRRSRSASLLDDNVVMQCFWVSQDSQQGLKEEGGAAGLASWKSIDRLDNSSKSLLATAIYYSHTSLQNVFSTHTLCSKF